MYAASTSTCARGGAHLPPQALGGLEGGYDGAGGEAWGDALAELDSAALAEAFFANLGLQPLVAVAGGAGARAEEHGRAAASAGAGAGVPDAAEGSRHGGLEVRQ